MAAPIGPYSPAYWAGDFLFCSGQIGISGDQLAEGLGAQTEQAFANLKALLEAEGTSLDKVVKTTVFLTDMAGFPMMNDIYAAAFGDHKPARSTVAVAALPKGALFEIEAIAYGK